MDNITEGLKKLNAQAEALQGISEGNSASTGSIKSVKKVPVDDKSVAKKDKDMVSLPGRASRLQSKNKGAIPIDNIVTKPKVSPLHMGRRTPSYSPPPRRAYGRTGRSSSPMGRYESRGRDLPTSLLVRNIRRDCRSEDLRRPFGGFGPLKDIYLPTDYYTGEPRGFGFVQYMDPVDAAEAKNYMDRQMFQGREITVVFAEERRKKPDDMRRREIIRHRVDYGRHYSPGDDVRSHLRSQSPVYYSPHREPFSRSYSPDDRRYPGNFSDRRHYDGDFHFLSHSQSRSLFDRPTDSYDRSPGRAHLRSRSPRERSLSYFQ